ncbi:MAG: hypothetical protein HUK25_00920 [Treponema sp.]|nr:hypothetical protein [Treponema sp.]
MEKLILKTKKDKKKGTAGTVPMPIRQPRAWVGGENALGILNIDTRGQILE